MNNGSSAPVVSLLCSSMSDQPIRDTGRDWISFTLTNRREHTRSIHCLLRQARTADARMNTSGHVTHRLTERRFGQTGRGDAGVCNAAPIVWLSVPGGSPRLRQINVRWTSRDMLAHVPCDNPGIKIVATAWRIAYDDTNCFTVVEFARRSVCSRFQKSKSAQ